MTEKRAYTPSEFAALFGREKSWTYRMVKAGKVKVIADLGRKMIPASEAARIEASGVQLAAVAEPEPQSVTKGAGTPAELQRLFERKKKLASKSVGNRPHVFPPGVKPKDGKR